MPCVGEVAYPGRRRGTFGRNSVRSIVQYSTSAFASRHASTLFVRRVWLKSISECNSNVGISFPVALIQTRDFGDEVESRGIASSKMEDGASSPSPMCDKTALEVTRCYSGELAHNVCKKKVVVCC